MWLSRKLTYVSRYVTHHYTSLKSRQTRQQGVRFVGKKRTRLLEMQFIMFDIYIYVPSDSVVHPYSFACAPIFQYQLYGKSDSV